MSLRRPLTVALALALALLALGGGALAVAQSGGEDDDPVPAAAPQDRQEHRAMRDAMVDEVVGQLARELDLPAERVRSAATTVLREQGESYDSRAERREAERELRADPERANRLRDELAADLGRELGVPAERVTAATRTVLADRLDEVVRDGWLSARQRTAALACFDDPASCVRLADRAGGLGAVLGKP